MLFLPNFVFPQAGNKILYDFSTNSTVYLEFDFDRKSYDTLPKPKFKRNSMIEVEVKNLNPFAIDMVVETKERFIHNQSTGFNFASMLGGMSSMVGDGLKLSVQNLPLENILSENELTSRGLKSRGDELGSQLLNINELSTNIEAMRSSLQANLLNPTLSKEEIKATLLKLSKIPVDPRLTNPDEDYFLYLLNLERAIKEDIQAANKNIQVLASEIEASDDGSVISRGETARIIYSDLEKVSKSLDMVTLSSGDNLQKIKGMHSMLEASSFEKKFDYLIEADKVNLEMKFIPSQYALENSGTSETATISTKKIELSSKGGFKVNSSVALTLVNFGANSSNYFISEDGIVGSEPNDFFTPNLSTFINFYPVISENLNFGGSFGLSVPLSGDINGINFLLGPSLFLGNTSRLSISGGIAFGPVNELTNGIQVGDQTNLRSLENFTRTVYKTGYYFGISFSLFDIK